MDLTLKPVSGRPNIEDKSKLELAWNFNEVKELNAELAVYDKSPDDSIKRNIAYEFLDVISGVAIWGKYVMYNREVKEQALYCSIMNKALNVISFDEILQYRAEWNDKKSFKYPKNSNYRTEELIRKAYQEYVEFDSTVK
jgi:hypothetical protein